MKDELLQLYIDTILQFGDLKHDHPDKQYWQGRKDAMRLCIALILPEQQDSMDYLIGSSPGYKPLDKECYNTKLKDAYDYMQSVLDDLAVEGKLHWSTKLSLQNWISGYDYLVEKGVIKE